MPVFIDPVTRQRVVYSKHCGDIVYDAEGDSTVTNESVPKLGPWKDYTGSGGGSGKDQTMYGGMTNKLWGTTADYEGVKIGNLNEVGQNKALYRRRRRKIHKKLD